MRKKETQKERILDIFLRQLDTLNTYTQRGSTGDKELDSMLQTLDAEQLKMILQLAIMKIKSAK